MLTASDPPMTQAFMHFDGAYMRLTRRFGNASDFYLIVLVLEQIFRFLWSDTISQESMQTRVYAVGRSILSEREFPRSEVVRPST